MNTTYFWSGFRDEIVKIGGFPTIEVKTTKDNVFGQNKPITTSRQNDISDKVHVKKPKIP